MKKLSLLLFPVMMLPILTSCKDVEHSAISIKRSTGFVSLTMNQLENLINSKQSFALEMYTDWCSHCVDLEPLLVEYVEKENQTIYRLNVNDWESETFAYYQEKYPSIFKGTYVPNIRFIKDGQLTYEVDNTKFAKYSSLSKIMNKHYIDSNITMIGSYDAFEAYKNSHSNYIVMVYELDDILSLELSAKYLITSEVAKAKKDIILLNKTEIANDFARFTTYFGVDYNSFASLIKYNQIEKTIDYHIDGSQINDIVSSL